MTKEDSTCRVVYMYSLNLLNYWRVLTGLAVLRALGRLIACVIITFESRSSIAKDHFKAKSVFAGAFARSAAPAKLEASNAENCYLSLT